MPRPAAALIGATRLARPAARAGSRAARHWAEAAWPARGGPAVATRRRCRRADHGASERQAAATPCISTSIDRWGNAVSATPSGGWLQSSPVVPGLGMPLNSRAQMFWLDDGAADLAGARAAGRAPRCRPSWRAAPKGRLMPFGTPGGDQQDQWQLILFLRYVHRADEPAGRRSTRRCSTPRIFRARSTHAASSPAHLMVEPAFGDGGDRRAARPRPRGRGGRALDRRPADRRHCAMPSGLMRAAATPRLMQAYAIAADQERPP